MQPAREEKQGRVIVARSVLIALILGSILAGCLAAVGQAPPENHLDGGIRALSEADFTHARQIFSDLVKRSPSAENVYYLGMAEAGGGDLPQAIEHFQESIRLGNGSAKVHYNLGIIYLESGRREEGIRELREAIVRDPQYVRAMYPLGVALLSTGRPHEAVPYLEQAHKSSPDDAETWVSLIQAQFEAGSDKLALQTAQGAAGAISGNPNLVVAVANLCLKHGQVQQARLTLEDGYEVNPHDPKIGLLLTRVNLQTGEAQEALAVLGNVPPEAGAPGETMYLRGIARGLARDFPVAEVDLSAALEAAPRNLRYLSASAWVQQREGHYKEALTILNKAHELDDQMPVIPFQTALSYFYLGLNPQAVQACQDAIRLAPAYAWAYFLMGAARLQQHDFEGAQSSLRHAVSLKRDAASFHLLLGVALYKGRSLEESARELDQALALNPQEDEAYFYRARLFALRDERRKAIADLETAVALQPHYKTAYAELARLYSAEGQADKAAAALAKGSAELQGEQTEEERMLQQLGDILNQYVM
jgi:tetratricopeptide (TPR) repeat protein